MKWIRTDRIFPLVSSDGAKRKKLFLPPPFFRKKRNFEKKKKIPRGYIYIYSFLDGSLSRSTPNFLASFEEEVRIPRNWDIDIDGCIHFTKDTSLKINISPPFIFQRGASSSNVPRAWSLIITLRAPRNESGSAACYGHRHQDDYSPFLLLSSRGSSDSTLLFERDFRDARKEVFV